MASDKQKEVWKRSNKKRYEYALANGLCSWCKKEKVIDPIRYCDKCKMREELKRQRIKDEVYQYYGGYKCACCGENNKKFLTIDHINNDGHKDKKEIQHYRGICRWLKRKGFPSGFRILCFNCNSGRSVNGGTCPHKDTDSKYEPFTWIG